MSSRRKQYKPKAAFGETALDGSNTTPTTDANNETLNTTANGAQVGHKDVDEATHGLDKNENPKAHLPEQEAINRKRKLDETEMGKTKVTQTGHSEKPHDLYFEEASEKKLNFEIEYVEDQPGSDEDQDESSPSSSSDRVNNGGMGLETVDEEDDLMGEEAMYEGEEDETGIADDDMDMDMYGSQTGVLDHSSGNGSGMGADANNSLLLVFKCKVCGKGFKHRRSLNRHVKLHSGEKNFKCPFCSTAFARSDHLKAHIRTHNNTKPYRCSVCHCGYSTQAALKVHIAHHHSKSKFRCVLCNNLEFHSQLALEGHIYTKHSKENKTGIDELINETATINPEVVNLDEASNYNLMNQRSRLIEINNYTNLNNNKSSSLAVTPSHNASGPSRNL